MIFGMFHSPVIANTTEIEQNESTASTSNNTEGTINSESTTVSTTEESKAGSSQKDHKL